MRFSCVSKDIQQAMDIVTRALPSRPLTEAYGCVLVTADDGKVVFRATDGALSMTATIPAQVADSGEVALDGRLFNEFVRKLPDDMVTLDKGNASVTLLSGSLKTQIVMHAGDDFPSPTPLTGNPVTVTLPSRALREGIDFSLYAVGRDETRKVLTGLLLEVTAGRVRTVGLDGFRMAIRDTEVNYAGEDIKVILPKNAAQEIAKLLRTDTDVELSIASNAIALKVENTVLTATLITGTYIDYNMLFSNDIKTRVCVNKKSFLSCVERAQIIARDGKNGLVKLGLYEDHITVETNAVIGSTTEETAADLQGEPMDVAFNCRYLLEALQAESDGRVELSLTNAVRPVVMRNVDNVGTLQMLLPVRLK